MAKAKKKSAGKKSGASPRTTKAAPGKKKPDGWKSYPVTISFRGQTFKGKIGIDVPGLSPDVYTKFFELASLCAQHAARFQPGA